MAVRWRHPNQRELSSLPPVLRRTSVPASVRAWIAREAGSPVDAVRRLPGASSSAVHEIRLVDGSRLVLRRWVWREVVDEEPEVPSREVAAIEWARRHGLPAPEIVAADPSGNEVGDGVPALLMVRVPGRAEASPDVDLLADLAVAVHAVSGDGFGHEYFPWCRETCTRPPATAKDPRLWERALELWHTAEPASRRTFIHRDFHPGNVLWSRGALTGLVDWPAACSGPPGVDIAACRWNLVDWAGPRAADAFVRAYEERVGEIHHPYWDLSAYLQQDYDLGLPESEVANAESQLTWLVPRVAELAD